ncbi:MAG TPA: DUF6703 family protein [Micromonosporaceae bacterium]|jgi:hypothetical protein|nr:DUF6703 family protein [Micromonosporaceae bacterium]
MSLLARLARLNRTTVFLVTIGVVLLALFVPGVVGGILLLALAAALAAILAKTWPVQSPRTRVLRVLILALLVTAAINKLT